MTDLHMPGMDGPSINRDNQLEYASDGNEAADRAGQPPVAEGSGQLLAADRWKAEGLGRIVVHGGCGAA